MDTRKNFTDHIYRYLKNKGILTFRDDEEFEKKNLFWQNSLKWWKNLDLLSLFCQKITHLWNGAWKNLQRLLVAWKRHDWEFCQKFCCNNIFCCNKVFLIIIKIINCNKIFVAIFYCHRLYRNNGQHNFFHCNRGLLQQKILLQ